MFSKTDCSNLKSPPLWSSYKLAETTVSEGSPESANDFFKNPLKPKIEDSLV